MNPSLAVPTNRPDNREAFFRDFRTMPREAFWKKYAQMAPKAKARYTLKKTLRKTGLEKLARRILS